MYLDVCLFSACAFLNFFCVSLCPCAFVSRCDWGLIAMCRLSRCGRLVAICCLSRYVAATLGDTSFIGDTWPRDPAVLGAHHSWRPSEARGLVTQSLHSSEASGLGTQPCRWARRYSSEARGSRTAFGRGPRNPGYGCYIHAGSGNLIKL